jgi:hypothetical protein
MSWDKTFAYIPYPVVVIKISRSKTSNSSYLNDLWNVMNACRKSAKNMRNDNHLNSGGPTQDGGRHSAVIQTE